MYTHKHTHIICVCVCVCEVTLYFIYKEIHFFFQSCKSKKHIKIMTKILYPSALAIFTNYC